MAAQTPTPPHARTTPLSQRLREMSAKAPLVIAHRGASGAFPENTMLAFNAALEAGTDMIELDFRATADGVLVCLHDDTLDRTTNSAAGLSNADVAISDVTQAEIQDLDAGSWKNENGRGARIPTLETALRAIQKSAITLLEHKAGTPEALIALLTRLDMLETVVVSSFDWQFLTALHAAESRVTIAALCHDDYSRDALRDVAATGASLIHWNHHMLTVEAVDDLHGLGYLVCAYTLNEDIAFLGGAAIGLDGITTDRPDRLRKLIATGTVGRPNKD